MLLVTGAAHRSAAPMSSCSDRNSTPCRPRRFGDDALNYAWGIARGEPGCTEEAITMLVDMRKEAEQHRERDPGLLGHELAFEVRGPGALPLTSHRSPPAQSCR